MRRCYVALGVDPAPGDPDGADALARTCRAAAAGLGGAGERVRALAGQGAWTGEAAGAVRDRLHALASRLDDAALALTRLAADLRTWAHALRDAQERAWRLERAARAAQLALPEEHAGQELAALRRAADRLRGEVAADGHRAVRAVWRATADAPGPTWRERPAELGERHGGLLSVVGPAAGLATLVVGGPVGLVLAGVALGATGLQAAAGDAGPLELALAGVGAATGGVAVVAARAASSARSGGASWAALSADAAAVGRGTTVGGLVVAPPVPAPFSGSASPRSARGAAPPARRGPTSSPVGRLPPAARGAGPGWPAPPAGPPAPWRPVHGPAPGPVHGPAPGPVHGPVPGPVHGPVHGPWKAAAQPPTAAATGRPGHGTRPVPGRRSGRGAVRGGQPG